MKRAGTHYCQTIMTGKHAGGRLRNAHAAPTADRKWPQGIPEHAVPHTGMRHGGTVWK